MVHSEQLNSLPDFLSNQIKQTALNSLASLLSFIKVALSAANRDAFMLLSQCLIEAFEIEGTECTCTFCHM